MFNSIKTKIFLTHLFLIIILLLSLSYKHYNNTIDDYTSNIMTYYTNSSSSIVTTSSLAISGANYGNIQLPSFINEVSKNKKLLYFKLLGISDNTFQRYCAIYDKKYQTIYRSEYPKDYGIGLKNKREKFKSKLLEPSSDKVKLNFLIERLNDKQKQYNQDIEYSKNLNKRYQAISTNKSSYIDFKNNELYLSLKTSNKNGGNLSLVFDISEIADIKSKILKDLLIETSIALLLSIFVLLILSIKIIGPLNKLSTYISKDFKDLKTDDIPGLNLKDEIGILSRSFKVLLHTEQKKQKKIEKKAYYDALTGIYNRNKFDEIFKKEIIRANRYSNKLTLAIIDIDKFKNTNDKYGHLIGDEVLVMMTENINNNIRSTDIFARWGGEEFVILFLESSNVEAKIISEKIKDKIQKSKHPIAGSLTISFGISQYIEGDSVKDIFKRADDALYLSKKNGRNRIKVL
jgi:diguanylate cyclase (GGDEF)-like protein